MERHSTSYQSQGLVKALKILRLLGKTEEALSLAELSQHLTIPKPSLLRLLSVLETEGFVYRAGDPPVYRVGHAVLEVAEMYRRQANSAEVASPYLRELAEVSGLTANIGILQGRWVLHVCVEEPDRPLRFRSSSGSIDHAYCTGLGKMLLSALPEEQVADHLPEGEPYPSFTEHTIANRTDIDLELGTIRERGYSIDEQERDLGVMCLAVRIPTRTDLNVALSVAGPRGELHDEVLSRYLPALEKTADALSNDARFIASVWVLQTTQRKAGIE